MTTKKTRSLTQLLIAEGCTRAQIDAFFGDRAKVEDLASKIRRIRIPRKEPEPKFQSRPHVSQPAVRQRRVEDVFGWTVADRLIKGKIKTLDDVVRLTAKEFCEIAGIRLGTLEFSHALGQLQGRELSFKR